MNKENKKGKEKIHIVKFINNIIESKIATILFLFLINHLTHVHSMVRIN